MVFKATGLTVLLFVIATLFIKPGAQVLTLPTVDERIFQPEQSQKNIQPIKQKIEQPKTEPKSNENNAPTVVTDQREEDDRDILVDNHVNTPAGNTPCDSCPDITNVLVPTGPPDIPVIPDEPVDWDGVDKLPKFKKTTLNKYLSDNMRIPQMTIDRGHRIKEKIGVSFVIDKEGNVTNVVLLNNSKYPELNEEAMRVIKNMPQWEPGEQKGHAVKVRMIQPLRFEVNE
jgi:TonB family protein